MKLDLLNGRVTRLEQEISDMSKSLHENTMITRQIEQHTGALVEMVKTYTDGKTTLKVLKGVGGGTVKLAAGGATIGGVAAAVWHWLKA
jgi:hypothetical protein